MVSTIANKKRLRKFRPSCGTRRLRTLGDPKKQSPFRADKEKVVTAGVMVILRIINKAGEPHILTIPFVYKVLCKTVAQCQ